RLNARLDVLEHQLGDRPFFFGDRFTVADAYTFWATRTTAFLLKRELPPHLKAFVARVGARPTVLAAEEAAGRRACAHVPSRRAGGGRGSLATPRAAPSGPRRT